jgi:hypothetical protein
VSAITTDKSPAKIETLGTRIVAQMESAGRTPGPRLWDFQMSGQHCNIDTMVRNRPRR